jgi:hypothetical protein
MTGSGCCWVQQATPAVASKKQTAAKKAQTAITLLWRAESYHYYGTPYKMLQLLWRRKSFQVVYASRC